MRCIICLNEFSDCRPADDEHVFPLAIGGPLVTRRVCKPCNSHLGATVDTALADHTLIKIRRSQLGLIGNSGKAPDLWEALGNAILAGEPTRRFKVRTDPKTGGLDVRTLYTASIVTLPDGSLAKQIILDERDAGQVATIIKRERQRAGRAPLSDGELAKEVEAAIRNVQTVDKPILQHSPCIDFIMFKLGVLKIAYELAFLWLGETYLEDQMASLLRAALRSNKLNADTPIPGVISLGPEEKGADIFRFWTTPETKNDHIAFAAAGPYGIGICVRVFDIFHSNVLVTADAARYNRDGALSSRLRFLTIDPSKRDMRECSFHEEMVRLSAAAASERRREVSARDELDQD